MPAMTVYLDTNILIYLFEQHDTYSHQVAEALQEFADSHATLITSTITIAEFLACTESSSLDTLRKVPRLQFVMLDENLAEQAANLLRTNNLQIGDAIHLATAIAQESVTTFFTNDKHLAKLAKQYLSVKQL